MPGKKGRSGRRAGSTSWWRNPVALAGHHLNVLIELWLADVPIQIAPDRWLVQPVQLEQDERGHTVPPKPDERRHTVPPKIKRALAKIAIAHVMKVYEEHRLKRPKMDDVMAWSRRRAPFTTLRRKAGSAVDEREVAYRQYIEEMANAWRGEQR